MDRRTNEDFQKAALALGLYVVLAKACALVSLALAAPNAFWPGTFAILFVSAAFAAVTSFAEALNRDAQRQRTVLVSALQQGGYELSTHSAGLPEPDARDFWQRHMTNAAESLRGDDEDAAINRSLGLTKPSAIGSFAFRLAGDAALVVLALGVAALF